MLSRLREHFGAAGLIVAVVALVAALGGGAIAATGGSGNGKATASAKGKQGPRGKTGKTGPAGPAGPAGSAGPQGAAGPKGDAGAPGSNGTTPTAESFVGALHGCAEGGIVVKSASPETIVCNGKKGAQGVPGGEGPPGPTCDETTGECLLPPGATETGVLLAATPPGLDLLRTAISYPLRLDLATTSSVAEGHRHFVTAEQQATPGSVPECPGTKSSPTAEPGNLCLYQVSLVNLESEPGFVFLGAEGRSGIGVNFVFKDEAEAARVSGTWALTACPPGGCLP